MDDSEGCLDTHMAPTSARSSLNRPFGSGLITPSGILLNSQMLDFSWPNRTANHSAPSLVGPCFPSPLGTLRLGSMAAPPSLVPLASSIIKKRNLNKLSTSSSAQVWGLEPGGSKETLSHSIAVSLCDLGKVLPPLWASVGALGIIDSHLMLWAFYSISSL